MKIIILSISPYKEKDIIVNAISEIGLITFKANGVLSLIILMPQLIMN